MISTPLRTRLPGLETADLLFAGLHFKLAAQLLDGLRALPHTLPVEPGHAPLARVDCEIESLGGAPLERQSGHPIEWSWHEGVGQARTRKLEARFERVGPRQFRVQARVATDPLTLTTLLSTVAPALLHALGGTVLHAASIELNRHAIAFIGPSGAGKSTACQHTAGARSFSLDRLAVVPGASGWVACRLPGGNGWEEADARSVHSILPLGAVLRVMHSQQGPWARACAPLRSIALLRQAAFHGDHAPGAERELLAALDALSRAVPVGELGFGLGDALASIIEGFTPKRTES